MTRTSGSVPDGRTVTLDHLGEDTTELAQAGAVTKGVAKSGGSGLVEGVP